MPTLTIEALRDNPWNVVTHTMPPRPSTLLLETAYCAATYCRESEYRFVQAARAGRYVPSWWQPTIDCPDAHEESEARGLEADQKCDEIYRLFRKEYGASLNS